MGGVYIFQKKATLDISSILSACDDSNENEVNFCICTAHCWEIVWELPREIFDDVCVSDPSVFHSHSFMLSRFIELNFLSLLAKSP